MRVQLEVEVEVCLLRTGELGLLGCGPEETEVNKDLAWLMLGEREGKKER